MVFCGLVFASCSRAAVCDLSKELFFICVVGFLDDVHFLWASLGITCCTFKQLMIFIPHQYIMRELEWLLREQTGCKLILLEMGRFLLNFTTQIRLLKMSLPSFPFLENSSILLRHNRKLQVKNSKSSNVFVRHKAHFNFYARYQQKTNDPLLTRSINITQFVLASRPLPILSNHDGAILNYTIQQCTKYTKHENNSNQAKPSPHKTFYSRPTHFPRR